jgi:release factor glutamine methyltransferase
MTGVARSDSGSLPVGSLDALLRRATDQLAGAGVASARVDAELLAAHVLGMTRGELAAAALVGRAMPTPAVAALTALVEQRADRIPLQHLTGRAAFRSLELWVGPGVFVPRPETEVVAGLAIDAAGGAARPLVVDLCTGSGAIALAVATEVLTARVVAIEVDAQALAWARRNVDRLAPGRVELRAGDVAGADTGVLADLAGLVDVVVANPPYIPPGARPVDPEVADHDPPIALFGGGPDGLRVPRAVVAAACGLLRSGGLLVMEHAQGQAAQVRGLTAGPAWEQVRTVRDLTGRDRALVAGRADPGHGSQPRVRDFGS